VHGSAVAGATYLDFPILKNIYIKSNKSHNRKLINFSEFEQSELIMLVDHDSIAILLSTIILSVGATILILFLMKLVGEKYSRRKYR
jgi:hypothetical protein